DVNAGVQSMAHLLSMLPGDLAAAIGGAVGVAPQQYGGDLVNQLYQQVLGRQGEASGVAYWQSVQQQGFGTENLVRAFINAAQQNGQSPLMGADDFLAGLPQFAGGGIADGPSTGYPVTLHGREAAIPMNGQTITVQQPELVAEVQALRQEVSRLRED